MAEQTRRRRHLMDPSSPRRPVNDRSLTNVQRWVMSALAVTTILHLSVGIVVAALFLPEDQMLARVGLCVIGGAFGVIAVAAGRAIHGKGPASPWLLLGLLPGVVGAILAVG